MNDGDWYEPLAEDDAVWIIGDPKGYGELYLTRAEMLEYNKDPYRWAGQQVGLTAEELREFIRLYGVALCGEKTKAGKFCRCVIGNFAYKPEEWKKHHREVACRIHAEV